MFIDSGTGPDPRGLDVFDLSQKKNVFSGSYSQPIALDKDRRLVYYVEVDEKKLKRSPTARRPKSGRKTISALLMKRKSASI